VKYLCQVAAILATILSIGCGQRSVALDPEWRPLEKVVEASWVQDGMMTTIAPIVYVRHFEDIPWGFEFDAILVHERVHAVRQIDQGVGFYRDYAAFPSVRWAEEKLAWSAEIAYRKAKGRRPDDEWCQHRALMASQNYARMVDPEVALAWFRAEVAK
jgi:hypothetical protein